MTTPRATRARRRATRRGLTLLEVLVSIGILALVGALIYGAFDGMARSRKNISQLDERYHQGRRALARMSRELQSAFISRHRPLVESQKVRETAFVGHRQSPADRVDFTSFSHRRVRADAHESDQNELSYFGSRDPSSSAVDLARRESAVIDIEPTRGGVVQVMVEDIDAFELSYLDPVTAEWTDSWDSTQPAGQFERLPLQVKIHLVLNGGKNGERIEMATRAPISMQTALNFYGLIPRTN
jgi:general secretion pathway protein J